MLRAVIVAALAYGYAHPAFDHYRPTVLAKPLQGLYAGINSGAQDTRRAFAVLNGARTMRYLDAAAARIGSQFH